jgi:hypothetical protein
MLGGKGKGGRVGQRESPSGTEVSPCLRVANLQKIFFFFDDVCYSRRQQCCVLVSRLSLSTATIARDYFKTIGGPAPLTPPLTPLAHTKRAPNT